VTFSVFFGVGGGVSESSQTGIIRDVSGKEIGKNEGRRKAEVESGRETGYTPMDGDG